MGTNPAGIDFLFNPRSIAFVGATEAKAKWGFIVFNNLVSGGYRGGIYPVNPGHQSIMGMRCYPSVRDIPDEVDLAVFTVPARQVPPVLKDCAEKGVKAALVISAGFRETGGRGAALEREIVGIADSAGMVLVGPNGQGLCCPENSLYPWMPLFYPREGRIAFVCQSGNILNMLIGHALERGQGVSKGVSSGNEAQLGTEDFVSYFSRDRATDVIVCYLEGVEDGRRFLDTMRGATARKPVVMLKGGRSAPGVAAAKSHTGALAVEASIFESACRQAGVTVTDTIRQAGITASAFVNRPLPQGRRVAIVTGGGGLGVLAADSCAERGLEVVRLSDRTLSSIGRLLPDYWVPGNPVDLVAGLDLTVVKPVLETIMRSGEADSVLFLFIEAPREGAAGARSGDGAGIDLSAAWDMFTEQVVGFLEELEGLARESGVPLYVASNFESARSVDSSGSTRLSTTVFDDVESACAAISDMVAYSLYLNSGGTA